MKGATEVPSTITVIIIQYTLIKRMKCELAFPISPTYCLNVKYSSHGLSPWKHTGAVGISHLATTTASPGVEGWRDLRGVTKSGEQHRFIPQNLAQAFWEREFGAAFSLSLPPFSFLAWGICHNPRGLCCSPPWSPEPCSESRVSHSPEGSLQCPQRLRKWKHLE